jgi:hypothetical protein
MSTSKTQPATRRLRTVLISIAGPDHLREFGQALECHGPVRFLCQPFGAHDEAPDCIDPRRR